MPRRTPPKPRPRSFWLTQKLRRKRGSPRQGQKPKTSSFAHASRRRTLSRVRKARPMSAFSSYEPSSPLCGARRRRGCASFQADTAAVWRSVCQPARPDARHGEQTRRFGQCGNLTESPTSRTCSRRWKPRRKLKQSRKLPTARGRVDRATVEAGEPTNGEGRHAKENCRQRPVETGDQDPAPAKLGGFGAKQSVPPAHAARPLSLRPQSRQ